MVVGHLGAEVCGLLAVMRKEETNRKKLDSGIYFSVSLLYASFSPVQ